MRSVCLQQGNPLHSHLQIHQLVHLHRHQINSLPTTTLISRLALATVVATTISNNSNSSDNNSSNCSNNNRLRHYHHNHHSLGPF